MDTPTECDPKQMASYLDPISREAFYSVWTNVEYVNYIPNKWVLAPQNNMSIFIEKEEEEQAYQKIQKIYSGSYGYGNSKYQFQLEPY